MERVLTSLQGVIKHTLNAYRDGKNVTAADNEHANRHCIEVVRHVSLSQVSAWDQCILHPRALIQSFAGADVPA